MPKILLFSKLIILLGFFGLVLAGLNLGILPGLAFDTAAPTKDDRNPNLVSSYKASNPLLR